MNQINIVDIEASGLGVGSYPIEIAILLDGVVHAWLIKPESTWTYWDEYAEEIHGITREHLLSDGLPAQQVADEINRVVADTNAIFYSKIFT